MKANLPMPKVYIIRHELTPLPQAGNPQHAAVAAAEGILKM